MKKTKKIINCKYCGKLLDEQKLTNYLLDKKVCVSCFSKYKTIENPSIWGRGTNGN